MSKSPDHVRAAAPAGAPASPFAELPTAADWRRNDLALFATVLVLLLLGWAVARQTRANVQNVDPGVGLPRIAYPAGWTRSSDDAGQLFAARNPAGAGAYRATVSVATRPLLADDTLNAVRTDVAFLRSRTLDRYRELAAQAVTVQGGAPAVLTTWAALADPARDSGLSGLPVVVQGQDLIFKSGNQWVIATTTANAAHSESEAAAFALFFGGFDLQQPPLPAALPELPADAAAPALEPVAPADPAPPAAGGFQSLPPAGVNP